MDADTHRTLLDRERRAAGEPSGRGDVVREYSPDDTECRIVYSHCAPRDVDDNIRREIALAKSAGYTLEWKIYDHDEPACLGERLMAFGFTRGPMESVLVMPLTEEAVAVFGVAECEIRRVHDTIGLNDVAEIAREVGRTNVDDEKRLLATALLEAPESLSVYVAYLDGEPVSSGRIYFQEGRDAAELAGGRTKTTHRHRGLFTAIVGARLREALARNRTHVFVDTVASSESILCKKGFEIVSHTQPFIFAPTQC